MTVGFKDKMGSPLLYIMWSSGLEHIPEDVKEFCTDSAGLFFYILTVKSWLRTETNLASDAVRQSL